MGMFDDTPYDISSIPVNSGFSYGDTNAFMIGAYGGARGMVSSVGKLAGFQDEEDMLKEIYETMDLSTEEGVNAAISAVSSINPEEGAKLQKQLTDSQVAKAQLATAKLATETANWQNATIKHRTALMNEFRTTVSEGGMKSIILQFLSANQIGYQDENPPTSMAMAIMHINRHFGPKDKSTASAYATLLKEMITTYQDAYVAAGVGRIVAGEGEAPKTYTQDEAFNVSLMKEMGGFNEWIEEERKKAAEAAQQRQSSTMSNISFGAY